MRNIISRIAALAVLLLSSGCGESTFSVDATLSVNNGWNAFVVSPVLPIFVTPGQSFTVIVQLIPVNGFVLSGPVFLNDFMSSNPGLSFACPGVVTVGTPALGGFANSAVPTVAIPVSPLTFGTCSIPLFLGSSGSFTVVVQISSSAVAAHNRWSKQPITTKQVSTGSLRQ